VPCAPFLRTFPESFPARARVLSQVELVRLVSKETDTNGVDNDHNHHHHHDGIEKKHFEKLREEIEGKISMIFSSGFPITQRAKLML
jgi:hypothetical protein